MNSLDDWNERMMAEEHQRYGTAVRTIESLGLDGDAVLVRQGGEAALWLSRGLSYWTLNDMNTGVRIETTDDLDAAIQGWIRDTEDGTPVDVVI